MSTQKTADFAFAAEASVDGRRAGLATAITRTGHSKLCDRQADSSQAGIEVGLRLIFPSPPHLACTRKVSAA